MAKAYRKEAGELVSIYGVYVGDHSPKYKYMVRYASKAYFSNDTGDLADQVAAAMRSNVAKRRERVKWEKKRLKEIKL